MTAALDPAFWSGRRVLVTGHTGFKGAWATLLLARLGARVTGLALAPTEGARLADIACPVLEAETIGDIRDPALVESAMAAAAPEIVLHLAAQALVRPSYADPCATFATNVLGTAHVLDAARRCPSVRAIVVVTTDKVYENDEAGRPFVEDDRLGGHDPYGASKACAELVAQSFRRSFGDRPGAPPIATARAGNVIGGGDRSVDRIVPDIVAAWERGEALRLRHPRAVRPWQHVLEPLAGYLILAEALVARRRAAPPAVNFAPDPGASRSVAELVEAFGRAFGHSQGWVAQAGEHPHEAGLLTLSAERAERLLGWRPLLGFDETVAWTAAWYRAEREGGDLADVAGRQIESYLGRLAASRPAALAEARSA